MLRTRLATLADVDRIAALTATVRQLLATWSPVWWRQSAAADRLHPLWLSHLVESDEAVVRVVEDTDEVVACAASLHQGGIWLIDDVAVISDARWPDAGSVLIDAIEERPALNCVPTAHTERRRICDSAGLRAVSSYWIGSSEQGDERVSPIETGIDIPPNPPHTFGGSLDPWAEGALTIAGGQGLLVGSPSVKAPPVYDPGGTVCIVDRVVGPTERHYSEPLRRALTNAATCS